LLRGEGSSIFQQDLAPAHNSESTKEWLSTHHIDVLGWLANLNPIEFVWRDNIFDQKATDSIKDKGNKFLDIGKLIHRKIVKN